jgi:hypothetical protein
MDTIVFVLYGEHCRWYSVFAKDNDLKNGYLSHMGPVTPPAKKRKDVVHKAKPGIRWCSRDREEAQRNRKGCLFGDNFIPFIAPGKDLFLEHIKPMHDPNSISKYIESAKWGLFAKPTGLTEEAMQQPRIIETSLASLLDHNLSEYCNKVARSLATSQKAAIDWIWRTTKFRTENEAVVHRTWKARALLFGQLEDHARHNPPDSPCNLEFTPEIVHLISGYVPRAATPHVQVSTTSKEEKATASIALPGKGSARMEDQIPLVDDSSGVATDLWSNSPIHFRPTNASKVSQESSAVDKTAEPQRSPNSLIFSKPPRTQFYRQWTVNDKTSAQQNKLSRKK